MGIIFPGRRRRRVTRGDGHRKRRVATPGFGHTPHDPIGGGYANLRKEGVHPYCAMMQVAAADEYDDYVICRGFDTRILKFVDYEEDNDDKPGISVAKPFGNRVQGHYEIGQVFPAFLPTQGSVSEGPAQGQSYVPPSPTGVDWRVGQNPGTTGGTTGGHPDDLDDAISELTDHNGKYVNWILIDSGLDWVAFYLTAQLTVGGSATAFKYVWDGAAWAASATDTVTVVDATNSFYKPVSLDVAFDSTSGCDGIAIRDPQSGQYHILEMEIPAAQITVTLAENMSETNPSRALVYTVDDYYRGCDPEYFWTVASDFYVDDPQGLFPRALDGAKAKATYDSRSERYHLVECQQMATMCKAKVNNASGVASSDSTFAVDTIVVMHPITGQDPETGDAITDPVVAEVANSFSRQYADDADLIIAWNEEGDVWEDITPSTNEIKWRRCQGKPTGNNGTTAVSHTVSVKACDYDDTDGSSETGDAFDVTTPVRGASKDTALFVGSVVGCVEQGDNKIIVTEFTDSPIGRVEMVNVDAAIRIGWRECVSGADLDMAGRLPIGVDTAATDKWDAINEDGGAETHGPGVTPTGHDTTAGPKGHADHPALGNHANLAHGFSSGTDVSADDPGVEIDDHGIDAHDPISAHDSHVAANHMPPWRAVKFIERFE